ncbi:hypothetical protein JOB18_016444 [Solea senegalensis]|uniref:Uncharacterized protein n=1 Tax=Solea senegalensis TaxID=28829 RepID=A0AAV6R8U8_SOLSE|nr:hypothetical protein JOB18_016444 [Solea senegalensis]
MNAPVKSAARAPRSLSQRSVEISLRTTWTRLTLRRNSVWRGNLVSDDAGLTPAESVSPGVNHTDCTGGAGSRHKRGMMRQRGKVKEP